MSATQRFPSPNQNLKSSQQSWSPWGLVCHHLTPSNQISYHLHGCASWITESSASRRRDLTTHHSTLASASSASSVYFQSSMATCSPYSSISHFHPEQPGSANSCSGSPPLATALSPPPSFFATNLISQSIFLTLKFHYNS